MSVSSICQSIRIGCSLSRLLGDLSQEEHPHPIEKIDFVSRSLVFGLEMGALGHKMANSSPKRIRDLKNIEFFIRFSTLPIFWIKNKIFPQTSNIASLENFLGPLIGVTRSFRERQELMLYDSNSPMVQECIPLAFDYRTEESDLGECEFFDDFSFPCETDLREAHQSAPSIQISERATNLSVLETALSTNLISQGASVTQKVKDSYKKKYEEYDLLKLDAIPSYLYTDPILSKYLCVITKAPIRHIVADPNRKALYEKEAIIRWIREHGTSPITRAPLQESDLVPLYAVQSLIDSRLATLTKLFTEAKKKNK